ncbi:SpoIIE family protein phosphatase [Chloracidobacterium aggregatum]|uniref:SpoIIE family protein phosphatase n=1 Tax=Chloracidobacterium aggregatum TaxID=2851959 RepID=UPI001B8D82E0|nr:SpoIIE family protein phosphatase [Chloracidobacterium aggregatum]QUV84519.1 SpoIIE family protein phosphatase [Chloracidobacterium sp. 2]QUV86983.1 SpoIIE family protein phosphatase [Chloracidobacterium sp. S]QUV89894.1 SpoIIE family protein phosphatase [Chloracidobacterium sp. A]QUV96261.1 SpoIIE family protein phosphatase [Chloracidobacterium sp. E]
MYSLVIHLPNTPPRRILLVKPRYTLGRSVRADIMVPDSFASRIHAALQQDGQTYILEDLHSANGTYYQGQRLVQPIRLHPGERFRIGETELEIAPETRFTRVAAPSVTYSQTSAATVPEAQIGMGTVNTAEEILHRAFEHSSGGLPDAPQAAPGETLLAATPGKPATAETFPETKLGPQRPDLLALVSKVGVTLLSNASFSETLEEVMSLVFESLPAERGFLLTYNHAQYQLECRVARTRTTRLPCEEAVVCQSITERVLTTKAAVLTSDARQDPRFAGSQSILLGDIRSVMCVPLLFREQLHGLIYVENPYQRRFTPDDLEVLTTIASVAAVKIENTRLLEEEMKRQRLQAEVALAARIQASMLPQCEPLIAGFEVAGLSRPAEDIGGDYYDYINVGEERLAVVIGDASGHGISSGLLMALAKGALFNQLGISPDPVHVMQTLNKLIHENGTRRDLMTFCYTLLDVPTGHITIANAGHPYPMVYCAATKTVHSLEGGAYPLGVRPMLGRLPILTHVLNPQDVLVMYSDGIPELKNRTGNYFGYDGLEAVIHRHVHLPARELCETIVEKALTFASGSIPEDDITVVVVKCTR